MERIGEFRGRYRFLSNFAPCWIVGSHGLVYSTSEAAFQAGRTTDLLERALIASATSPGEAKRRGRHVNLVPGSATHRQVVMRAALRAKFADPHLAALLLDTGDAVLVEGNSWQDNEWGDCHCRRGACVVPGRNWLGRHLMDLRDELITTRIGGSPLSDTV